MQLHFSFFPVMSCEKNRSDHCRSTVRMAPRRRKNWQEEMYRASRQLCYPVPFFHQNSKSPCVLIKKQQGHRLLATPSALLQTAASLRLQGVPPYLRCGEHQTSPLHKDVFGWVVALKKLLWSMYNLWAMTMKKLKPFGWTIMAS